MPGMACSASMCWFCDHRNPVCPAGRYRTAGFVDTTQLILNADDHHFWQLLFLGFVVRP